MENPEVDDVADALPRDLVDRVHRWGDRMDAASGSEDDYEKPSLTGPQQRELNREFRQIRLLIKSFGYSLDH